MFWFLFRHVENSNLIQCLPNRRPAGKLVFGASKANQALSRSGVRFCDAFTQIVNEPVCKMMLYHRNRHGQKMHIPLSRDEIAAFFEIAPKQVDLLWRGEFLQRSLHCTYRPVASLNYSTIYDVLEYALTAGVLPIKLSKECAALWVFQLAELDEWDVFERASTAQKAMLMMEAAMDDGLADMTENPLRVASVTLSTQVLLFELCSDLKVAS
ncbi:hypothetical protein [Tateyamaria sp. SN3-11]|uniref:hypothetical protein n=1 Tax=Tateyamaria sp. SN3-11 TaxID=3092147 RepID=UPI0039E7F64D